MTGLGKRGLRAFIALLAAALAIPLLTGITAAGASVSWANKPQKGGVLKYLYQTEMTNFLPENHSSNIPVHDLVYDRLIDVDPSGKAIPAMAESLTQNTDGTWTLKLRSGIKFSDGTPLNSAAIKTYWDYLAGNPALGCNAALKNVATTWIVADDLTLKITPPATAGPRFPRLLGGAISGGTGNAGCVQTIPSPTARAAAGANFASHPVGAGPFLLKEWVPSDHMIFVRNPNYWQKGKPYLDEIDTKLVPDAQTRCDTYQAGGYQVLQLGTAVACQAQVKQSGAKILIPSQTGGIGFEFGLNKAPTDDASIRQALAYAVDPADLVQKAVAGQTSVVDYFFPKDSPFFVNIKNPVNNLPKAQSLIDAYAKAHGGGPVQIDFAAPIPIKAYTDVLVQQISRLNNVKVNVRLLDGPGTSKSLLAKDYNINFVSWAGFDPDSALGLFATGASATAQYSNATVDGYIHDAALLTNVPKKVALYNKIITQLNTDMPGVAIWRADRPTAIDAKTVQAWKIRPGSLFGPYMENVWLKSKK
jgi:peptide/nickel transport system substrate-binding protein